MIQETKECQRCGRKIKRNKKQFACHWAQVKYCRSCVKINQNESSRNWNRLHKAEIMAYRKRWRQEHLAYQRLYYQQNRGGILELRRKYYDEHKDKRMSGYQRRYRLEHREELRAYFRQYYLKHKYYWLKSAKESKKIS